MKTNEQARPLIESKESKKLSPNRQLRLKIPESVLNELGDNLMLCKTGSSQFAIVNDEHPDHMTTADGEIISIGETDETPRSCELHINCPPDNYYDADQIIFILPDDDPNNQICYILPFDDQDSSKTAEPNDGAETVDETISGIDFTQDEPPRFGTPSARSSTDSEFLASILSNLSNNGSAKTNKISKDDCDSVAEIASLFSNENKMLLFLGLYKGISVGEIAEEAGVTRQTMYQYAGEFKNKDLINSDPGPKGYQFTEKGEKLVDWVESSLPTHNPIGS